MTSPVEQAILEVLLGLPAGTLAELELRQLVGDLQALSCTNLAAKLREFKGAGASGRIGALCAELKLARLLARRLQSPVDFRTGNTEDVRFAIDGALCLMDARHRSSSDTAGAVFYPDPALLPTYATGNDWKQAAHRLHEVVNTLPIEIQPWLTSNLLHNPPTRRDRGLQEAACRDIANWLAAELPDAVRDARRQITHPDGRTRFELTLLDAPPGRILGSGCVDAWIPDEGTIRRDILEKSSKAKERLDAARASCYVVGLVIDDAFASTGTDLMSSLYGSGISRSTSSGTYSYRPVPVDRQRAYDDAVRLRRQDLLDLARLDRDETNLHGFPEGLYFDAACADVCGVLALYYTEQVQYLPNPFSLRNIDPLCRLFPQILTPFAAVAGG